MLKCTDSSPVDKQRKGEILQDCEVRLCGRCSDVVLGDVLVVVAAEDGRCHVVLIGVYIGHSCLTLQVRAVPSCELVLAGLAERGSDVALGVVGPDFAYVEVLDEHNRVTAPELLCGNQSAWGHNAAWSKLSTFLDASAFKNDAFLTDHNIIFNMARVER